MNMKILIHKIIFFSTIIIFNYILISCTGPETKSYVTGLFTKSIIIDGLDRRYAIYIPKDIENTKVPLIFELHGGGIYIEDMTGESGHKTPYKLWMELAESEKFIVIYPEGLNGAYGKPTWNDCRGDCMVSSNANDVHFIDTLISVISSNHRIDTNRIYISGTSNGGFMAQRLGIELNSKIAAIASIVAAKPAISKCKTPKNPISILFMNGTNDNHMPYEGGYVSNPANSKHGSVLSTAKTIDYWIHFNKADTVPSHYIFPDLDTKDGGFVEKFSYKNGINGTEIILYKVNGGGHSAPSIREQYSSLFEKYFNKQNHDIEMTTEVWNFFKNKILK